MLKQDAVSITRARAGVAALLALNGALAATVYVAQPVRTLSTAPVVVDVPASYDRVSMLAYPKAAIAEKLAGVVTLRVHIGSDGVVRELSPDPTGKAPPVLLRDAVKTWRFTPARHDGVAVDSRVAVPVVFTLDADAPADGGSAPATLDAIGVGPSADKT